MPRALALLLLALAASAATAEPHRDLTLDDVMAVRNVVEVRLSPAGSRVAFVVSSLDAKENRYDSNLWLVDPHDKKPLQLTTSPKRDEKPRWSPDGKSIAFLSDRSGKMQVWLLSLAGGEAKQLTDHETAVVEMAWSPDGKSLAFVAASPESPEQKKRKETKADVVLVEKDDRPDRLHVLDLATGKARQVTDGPGHVLSVEWSPDGMSLAYGARKSPRLDDLYEVDVFVVESAGGKPKALVQKPGLDALPRWSPDGKLIAFVSHQGEADWIGNTHLRVIDLATQRVRTVAKFDEVVPWSDPEAFAWSKDGDKLFFSAQQRLTSQVFAVGQGAEVKAITSGDKVHERVSYARDRIACTVEDGTSTPEVCTLGRDGTAEKLTDLNPHLRQCRLGHVEAVRYKGKDGRSVEGLLVKPVGYQKGKRYPLITVVHGGPAGRFALAFAMRSRDHAQGMPYQAHLFAARGYAVFCPNPRGSAGYGLDFRTANVKDWGGGDFDDIMAGIDALVERGVADEGNLGLCGWSYGGFMTGWSITRTDRFRCASAGAGVYDLTSMYGQTDIPSFMDRYLGGTPWEARQTYDRLSSVRHAAKVKTPTLIQHGEKDLRVPLAQSQELFVALKKHKVPVEFVVYPRQPHGIVEPALQRDAIQRNLDWFDRWMKK